MFNWSLQVSSNRRVIAIGTVTLVAVLSACGGGTERKKNVDGGAGGPTFSACLTQAAPVAAAQLAEASIVDGALLYDKWYSVLEVSGPTTPQPLWALRSDPSVEKAADETWRCKNCHDWSYTGTLGFPSLLTAKSADQASPENIFCAIKAGTETFAEHTFADKLLNAKGATTEEKDVHIWNLTKFIIDANGMIDTSAYIAANGGGFNAVRDTGKSTYASSCSACHLADGSKYDDGVGLGGIAVEDPWEFMHKARFGDPAVVDRLTMPPFQDVHGGVLTLQQIANIIAWAQGVPPSDGLKGGTGVLVPTGTPGTGSSGGGSTGGGGAVTQTGKFLGASLYDSIPNTLGTIITSGNPLWDALKASTTATTDVGTWRCKNCHGWDYKGVAGQNAGGFASARGPANLLAAQAKDAAQLKATIKSGYVNNTTTGVQVFHAFGRDAAGAGLKNGTAAIVGPGLSDVEIDSIVDFIKNGMIDTATYIGVLGGAFGDPVQGQAMYTNTAITKSGACVTCHGDLGNKLDFEDGNPAVAPNEFVGTIALTNPWEFFHKVRWGQPGSTPLMRGTVEAGIPDAQIANLLRYGQTLPIQ